MACTRILGFASMVSAAIALVGPVAASATELYSGAGSTTLPAGSTLTLTLKAGTSSLFEEVSGGVLDTCTGSEIKLKTSTASGGVVSGKTTTLTFSGCSHTTATLTNGEFEIEHLSGTNNGLVQLVGARVTTVNTTFGISCTNGTGSGAIIGTMVGAPSGSGNARLVINGVIPSETIACPAIRWTAEYTVTSPLGLVVKAN